MAYAKKSTMLDGRNIRELDGKLKQAEMFTLNSRGLFAPAVESITSIKDHDEAIDSGAYVSLINNCCWRCKEYAVYHKDPSVPLGKEILWIEEGNIYKKLIPDVPVKFNGNEISLQKAAGMGVYDSIGLLKIEQTDSNLFLVSVVDPAAVVGRVRAVDFMRDGWAMPDETGLPMAARPSLVYCTDARFGSVATKFEVDATGWHGSLARFEFEWFPVTRWVGAFVSWSGFSAVNLIERREATVTRDVRALGDPSKPAELPFANVLVSGALIESSEREYAVISEHTGPEKLVALRQLLDSLKIRKS